MSKKRFKQYLMLLAVIGLVAIASGGSTFASFSAETTNPGNVFATGTLYLHDTPNGGTTCTSEAATTGPNFNINPGDGSNGAGCTALFVNKDLSQGATTAHIALANAGSLDSTHFQFKVSNCTWGDNSQGPAGNIHLTFIAPPANCNGIYVTIQETQSDYTTPVYCAYGTNSSGSCAAPSNSFTLGGATGWTNFLTTGGNPAQLNKVGGTTPTRYYVITADPSGVGAGNALQNLRVSFDLSFHIDNA